MLSPDSRLIGGKSLDGDKTSAKAPLKHGQGKLPQHLQHANYSVQTSYLTPGGGGDQEKGPVQRKDDKSKHPQADMLAMGKFERALHVEKLLQSRPLDLDLLTKLLAGKGLAAEFLEAHGITLEAAISQALPAKGGRHYDRELLLTYAKTGAIDTRLKVAVALGLVLANKMDPAAICTLMEAAPIGEALELHEEFVLSYVERLKKGIWLKRLEAHRAYLEHYSRPPTAAEIESFTTESIMLRMAWLATQIQSLKGNPKDARALVLAFSKSATAQERRASRASSGAVMKALEGRGDAEVLERLLAKPQELGKNLKNDASDPDAAQKDNDDAAALHGMNVVIYAGDENAILEQLDAMTREQSLKYLARHLKRWRQSELLTPTDQGSYYFNLDLALMKVTEKLLHSNDSPELARTTMGTVTGHNNKVVLKIAELRSRLRYVEGSTAPYLGLRKLFDADQLTAKNALALVATANAAAIAQIKGDRDVWNALRSIAKKDQAFADKLDILAGSYRPDIKKTVAENNEAIAKELALDPRRVALKLDHACSGLQKEGAVDAEIALYSYVKEMMAATKSADAEDLSPAEVDALRKQFLKTVWASVAKETRTFILNSHHALASGLMHGSYDADPMALMDTAIKNDPARIAEVVAAMTDADILVFTNVSEFFAVVAHGRFLLSRLEDIGSMIPDANAKSLAVIKLSLANIHAELKACHNLLTQTPLRVSPAMDAKLGHLSLTQQVDAKLAIQAQVEKVSLAKPEIFEPLSDLGVALSPEQIVKGSTVLLMAQQELTKVNGPVSLFVTTTDAKLAVDTLIQMSRDGANAEALASQNKAAGKANEKAFAKKTAFAKSARVVTGSLMEFVWNAAFGAATGGGAILAKLVTSWLTKAVTDNIVQGQAYDGEKARNQLLFDVFSQVLTMSHDFLLSVVDGKDGNWRDAITELVGNEVLAATLIAEVEAGQAAIKGVMKDVLVEGQNSDEARRNLMNTYVARYKSAFLGVMPLAQAEKFFAAHVKDLKKTHLKPGDEASMVEKGLKKSASLLLDSTVVDPVKKGLKHANKASLGLLVDLDKKAAPEAGKEKKATTKAADAEDDRQELWSPNTVLKRGSLAQIAIVVGIVSDNAEALAKEARDLGNIGLAKNRYLRYVESVVTGKAPVDEALLTHLGLSPESRPAWFKLQGARKRNYHTLKAVMADIDRFEAHIAKDQASNDERIKIAIENPKDGGPDKQKEAIIELIDADHDKDYK